MPILTQDIKLLKSAVMADTSDGGGQMTGVEVIDGQSNNLFPDTSAMDRALGRVALRKVFGVAQTTGTDTLLGAHAVIVDAPDDPLVHCTLIKTAGWADDRTVARTAIENYLVKGPKAGVRIYDTHYSGSLQLRLISFVNAPFPAGGDAIVLHNPSGTEQYVRLLKVTLATQNVAVVENGTTVVLAATVATCDLGQALSMDVLGPPAARAYGVNGIAAETTFALLYTTNFAGGAKFYGIKPLGVAGVIDDLSVMTTGGIYTPVVPAATIETPVIDQYPYLAKSGVIGLSYAAVTLPAVTMAVVPNAVISAPGPITPGSVALTAGATEFTDNLVGDLLQGSTKVGVVSYSLGTITMLSTAPSYGSVSTTLTYRPAVYRGAKRHSASFLITSANQGLGFTNTFAPHPVPQSFSLDYMAQGRWYTLTDDGNGKLAGPDSSYGVGTLNYATGSMAVTLGVVPDVDSVLLACWGDADTLAAVSSGTLPTKFSASLVLTDLPDMPTTVGFAWANGATNYTATAAATGVITGGAVGQLSAKTVQFTPTVFPSGDITVTYSKLTGLTASTAYTGSGLAYTLSNAPVALNSVSALLSYTLPGASTFGANQGYSQTVSIYDRGGLLYCLADSVNGFIERQCGTVNYATGAVVLSASFAYDMWQYTLHAAVTTPWPTPAYYSNAVATGSVTIDSAGGWAYTYGSPTLVAATDTITPASWSANVPLVGATLVRDSVRFNVGADRYGALSGTVRKGWNISTALADNASCGVVTSAGMISITSLPANMSNSITWYNAVQDNSVVKSWGGVFRTAVAPIKQGVFQIMSGALLGNSDNAGVITGNITGNVDSARGVASWTMAVTPVDPAALTYNTVYLQYLPLDATLLGMDTTRLPLDGKCPIYRTGDLVVVHNTLTYIFPNPLVKNTVYDMGRVRIASVRVKDALGVVVPDTLYVTDLQAGTITVPTASDITSYTEPLAVEHRIEDMLLCSQADISGQLKFTRSLTHDFPADTSFVSSAMPFGDLFARVYSLFEQSTWTSVWSDTLIGAVIIPQFNSAAYPIVVTNAGAIRERWVLIFTNTTSFRVIGESVGEIAAGNTTSDCAPVNPATGVPYFTIPALGWGSGWSTSNCLRYNTDACGAPFWAVRTVLQGPASIDSDQFTLAFRGDVDRP